jgi:peptidyl-prolyl cis-trans isomerase SurA
MRARLTLSMMLLGLGLLSNAHAAGPQPPASTNAGESIIAIVNNDLVSRGDVDNRRRLFALSSGLPVTDDVLNRLTPQVVRQLIDERLRLQETQRRRVIVQDKQIAEAIAQLERGNNMPPGMLQKRLAASGVALRTLIDQLRVQIGWSQLIRQAVQLQGEPSAADVEDQAAQIKAQIGQPEFRMAEIFIPAATPAQDSEARRFVETIIQQLRAGAPFAVVAAQFSQSQTALSGGDLGWVQATSLDPEVVKVVSTMPAGAVSNPIKVAGGYSIVTLLAKREVGRDMATIIRVRQIWLPFTSLLNPTSPTAQQLSQLEKARSLALSIRSCDAADAANKAAGGTRPSDPGELRLEQMSGPQRALINELKINVPSPPLPAEDGINLIIVCSKETKNMGIPGKEELIEKIMNERVELTSRQMMRDLQRRAVIDQRG